MFYQYLAMHCCWLPSCNYVAVTTLAPTSVNNSLCIITVTQWTTFLKPRPSYFVPVPKRREELKAVLSKYFLGLGKASQTPKINFICCPKIPAVPVEKVDQTKL